MGMDTALLSQAMTFIAPRNLPLKQPFTLICTVEKYDHFQLPDFQTSMLNKTDTLSSWAQKKHAFDSRVEWQWNGSTGHRIIES